MKSAKNIVSHLRDQPSLKKVSHQRCIAKTVLLLPPGLQNKIRFTYIKNGVLFFVLNHPGAKMEFDNIIKSIKKPLKEMMGLCDPTLVVSDIKAFVTHKPQAPKVQEVQNTAPDYTERALADFTNHFEHKKLHEIFEQIRKIIDDTNPSKTT